MDTIFVSLNKMDMCRVGISISNHEMLLCTLLTCQNTVDVNNTVCLKSSVRATDGLVSQGHTRFPQELVNHKQNGADMRTCLESMKTFSQSWDRH